MPSNKVSILMVGTGEYSTGYVGGTAADSDKGSGVVGLTCLDLRRRGKADRLAMCGVNGRKFPGIREHMKKQILEVYADMGELDIETFPKDDQVDPKAYLTALDTFQPGDLAILFTPDDTHFEICMACIERGLHVLVTKPIVQTLADHQALCQAAAAKNVLIAVEVHKRWDPFYADARDRARNMGDFQYMYAYMSQPKHQLQTFKAWAGKSSDISYYLNSHHVDWSEWTLHGIARPIRVTATGSTGIAQSQGLPTEDSITLTVQWQNVESGNLGCAVYTSSWVAPKSDVHSQQRFFYMGSTGEINVDQAHRGCTVSTDEKGFASVNPLFMKYTPTAGKFSGQGSYGVQSFEHFVDACRAIQSGTNQPSDYNSGELATVHTTLQGTAVLEAGRRSLDADGQPMDIVYDGDASLEPKAIEVHNF